MSYIVRADAPNVLAPAAAYLEHSMNLRFDLCTAILDKPTPDIEGVF